MTAALPLSRFTVLDLTQARAGPTAVRQLADWGARCIKVEHPAGAGGGGTGQERHDSDFQNLHRNKESITLNLKHPQGRALFERLAAGADVVVENFRPAVKHRLGIDPERLWAVNPCLVYGSISGFGQSGPYRDRPGLDQVAQGLGGLMSVTGFPKGGPVRAGIPIGDLTAGILLAQGILVALLEREVTGRGRWVHTSLLEAVVWLLDFQAARWLLEHEVPGRTGNDHPTLVPTGVARTADGYINYAASRGPMYVRFMQVLGLEALLDDPRFADEAARAAHRDAMAAALAPAFLRRTSAEWVALLSEAGVPCGPIRTVEQALGSAQVRHLGIAQPVTSPRLGRLTLVGQPVHLARTPASLRTAAPEMGAHNAAVYGELGLDAAALADLGQEGVV